MIELIYGRAGSEADILFEKDGKSFNVKLKRVDANAIKWHVHNAPAKQDPECRIKRKTNGSHSSRRTAE